MRRSKILELSDTYRPYLLLAVMGLSHRQVAKLLTDVANTVRSYVARARHQLVPGASEWSEFLSALVTSGDIELVIHEPGPLLRLSAQSKGARPRVWKNWLGEQMQQGQIQVRFCDVDVQREAAGLVASHLMSTPEIGRVLAPSNMTREDARASIKEQVRTHTLQ